MNKSELKTGMVVELRNGDRYLVFKDASYMFDSHSDDIMVCIDKPNNWFSFNDSYNENLKYEYDSDDACYDIMKVYKVYHPYNIIAHEGFMSEYDIKNPDGKYSELTLLWERPTAKQMSKADIEEALGYEIEIVE